MGMGLTQRRRGAEGVRVDNMGGLMDNGRREKGVPALAPARDFVSILADLRSGWRCVGGFLRCLKSN